MDADQLVAIGNAVMRIVCGDSRSYYVGRPVEEMNPLIKATFDWGGKQGWSAEQIPQYFGDSFLAYFSGMLGIRYRCASLWLHRAYKKEDADCMDFALRASIEKSGLFIPEESVEWFV